MQYEQVLPVLPFPWLQGIGSKGPWDWTCPEPCFASAWRKSPQNGEQEVLGNAKGTTWYSEINEKSSPKKQNHQTTLSNTWDIKMWWMVGNGHEWLRHELMNFLVKKHRLNKKKDQKRHEKHSKWHLLSPCISCNFQSCQEKQQSEWPTDCLNSRPSIPQT